MMTGTQAQFDADIKLMQDTALASTLSNFLVGQRYSPVLQLFNSGGKTQQTPMRLRTLLIECLPGSTLKPERR